MPRRWPRDCVLRVRVDLAGRPRHTCADQGAANRDTKLEGWGRFLGNARNCGDSAGRRGPRRRSSCPLTTPRRARSVFRPASSPLALGCEERRSLLVIIRAVQTGKSKLCRLGPREYAK